MKKPLAVLACLLIALVTLGQSAVPPLPIGITWTGPMPWTKEMILGPRPGKWWTFLENLRDRPWDRQLLGWPAGQVGASASQFYTLSKDRRADYVAAWRKAKAARTKLTLGIYGGTVWAGDPFSFEVPGEWVPCNFHDQADWAGMWNGVIDPWRKLLVDYGSTPCPSEWWWDAGSGFGEAGGISWRENAADWIAWLDEEHGIKGGTEAIGLRADGSLDVDWALRTPQMGAATWDPAQQKMVYFHPGFPQMIAPPGSKLWIYLVASAGPGGPEVHVTLKELVDCLKRGFGLAPDQPHDSIVIEAYKAAGVPVQ